MCNIYEYSFCQNINQSYYFSLQFEFFLNLRRLGGQQLNHQIQYFQNDVLGCKLLFGKEEFNTY